MRSDPTRRYEHQLVSERESRLMTLPDDDLYRLYLAEVEKLLKATPTYPDLLNRRGMLQLHLGDTAGAKKDFVAALARNPRYEQARVNLAFAMADDDFRGSLDLIANIAKSSVNTCERFIDMARLCYLHQHTTEAWDALYHAIDLDRHNSLPLHWGAYFLCCEDRHREAHRWLLRSARISGGGVEAYEKLEIKIDAVLSVEDFAKTIREVSPIPGFAEIHMELARWLYTCGKKSESVVELEKILIHDPHFAPFATHRGWMDFLSGHHQQAESWLLKALECDHGYAPAHEQLAHFYTASGDGIRAEHHLIEAIALRRGYPDLRFDVALRCIETDRLEEAVSHLRSCLAIAPSFSMARVRLGECYVKLEEFGSAMAQFHLLTEEMFVQPDVKELVATCHSKGAAPKIPASISAAKAVH